MDKQLIILSCIFLIIWVSLTVMLFLERKLYNKVKNLYNDEKERNENLKYINTSLVSKFEKKFNEANEEILGMRKWIQNVLKNEDTLTVPINFTTSPILINEIPKIKNRINLIGSYVEITNNNFGICVSPIQEGLSEKEEELMIVPIYTKNGIEHFVINNKGNVVAQYKCSTDDNKLMSVH